MSKILSSLHLLMMETASIDTLFHTTEAYYALQIMKENQFRLPLAETNSSETKGKHLHGLYYLSTARNLTSGYISDRGKHLGTVNLPVTFVLDTKKIRQKNRGIKIVSFDYWGMDAHGRSLGSGREAEERIYSNNRRLNIKGAYKVLIFIRDAKWERLWMLRQVYSYCLKNKIPVKLFTWNNVAGFRLQKENPEDRQHAIELMNKAKREHGYQTSHKGISPSSSKTAEKFWNKKTAPDRQRVSEYMAIYHLVTKKDWRDLPRQVKERYFTYGWDPLHKRFEGYLHNLRSSSAQGSEEVDKLDKLIKQMKAKSVKEFFEKLEKKWDKLQQENSDREQREWEAEQRAKGIEPKPPKSWD